MLVEVLERPALIEDVNQLQVFLRSFLAAISKLGEREDVAIDVFDFLGTRGIFPNIQDGHVLAAFQQTTCDEIPKKARTASN